MKAYELIKEERNWTRDLLCFDANGKSVAPEAPTCVKWNIVGAIRKCYPGDGYIEALQKAFKACKEIWGVHSLIYFNSQEWRPHSHIITTLKEADV